MTTRHWPTNNNQNQHSARQTRHGWLILFFGLALFGLQLLSVTHQHHDEPTPLADTCLICSANSVSGAGSALPATMFQLSVRKAAVNRISKVTPHIITESPAFFLSRAPPANA